MLEAQPSSTLRLLVASSARKGRWIRHHQMEDTLPKKNWSKNAILFTPPLIPAGIRWNPGIPSESIGIQEFRRNPSESRNSGRMDRIPDGFLSIPPEFKRKTTLHKTDQSYTKEITIKGISSCVQSYHIRKIQQMMLTMMNNASFVIWVPCRFQRHGTWFKLKKIQRKYCIMYV